MTVVNMFDDMDKDTLIKDIDQFHKKFKFEKNDKVGIPENNELVNFRTSFLVELGSNHEQQHQELMLMDIKNIFYNNPLMPTYNSNDDKPTAKEKNELTLEIAKKFKYGITSFEIYSPHTLCLGYEFFSMSKTF